MTCEAPMAPDRSAEPGGGVATERWPTIWAWRHPRPPGCSGRCIGRTDLPVDPRQARRIAHRIRHKARELGLPRVIHASPLARCHAVARYLKSWGWSIHVDEALLELDFGDWSGLRWDAIPRTELDRWMADFIDFVPGNGESLRGLMSRVSKWRSAHRFVSEPTSFPVTGSTTAPTAPTDSVPTTISEPTPNSTPTPNPTPRTIRVAEPLLVIGHAGWMTALRWQLDHGERMPTPAEWPVGPRHGECWELNLKAPGND